MSKSYYMRDNHTFLPLPVDVEAALDALYREFCEGDAFGMLCTKHEDLKRVIHADGDWEKFRHEARRWLTDFKMIKESS